MLLQQQVLLHLPTCCSAGSICNSSSIRSSKLACFIAAAVSVEKLFLLILCTHNHYDAEGAILGFMYFIPFRGSVTNNAKGPSPQQPFADKSTSAIDRGMGEERLCREPLIPF